MYAGSSGAAGFSGSLSWMSSPYVTGSWDEDSSYASWTGVSSGTGLVLRGMIGSKDCHSRFDVCVRVS